jgi:hypothetical protein
MPVVFLDNMDPSSRSHLLALRQSIERIFKVCLTSINLQKKILKNPVFKSTIFFLDVY